MTTQHNRRYTSDGRSPGRFGPFAVGILFTLAVFLVGGWLYLKYGAPPVAVADKAFPFEAQIVKIPLNARIARDVEKAPFGISEDVFEAGAKVYARDCAFCHGTPGHDSEIGRNEYPTAPQLWKRHGTGPVVGVSDDDAAETYWKIKNGIRLTGMPAYKRTLSDAQMWDVALLLKNADQTLPDPVVGLLDGRAVATPVATGGMMGTTPQ
jgi:thiosulfate dehydrogenase